MLLIAAPRSSAKSLDRITPEMSEFVMSTLRRYHLYPKSSLRKFQVLYSVNF